MGHKGAGLMVGLYAGKLIRTDVQRQAIESINNGPEVTALARAV